MTSSFTRMPFAFITVHFRLAPRSLLASGRVSRAFGGRGFGGWLLEFVQFDFHRRRVAIFRNGDRRLARECRLVELIRVPFLPSVKRLIPSVICKDSCRESVLPRDEALGSEFSVGRHSVFVDPGQKNLIDPIFDRIVGVYCLSDGHDHRIGLGLDDLISIETDDLAGDRRAAIPHKICYRRLSRRDFDNVPAKCHHRPLKAKANLFCSQDRVVARREIVEDHFAVLF